ncbi:hypothetical protein CYMTET_12268 [Cymbomonas tetramitiformis]|uniref:Uncharacterized protein n=1 Tax=Cymbomonas tetramitiformis TaxID=36881 RepID=A0AAE0GKU5_9CHLO|nr:hypothetical protein CYMTET_12268 [Cymbomonas tetramitiformis]
MPALARDCDISDVLFPGFNSKFDKNEVEEIADGAAEPSNNVPTVPHDLEGPAFSLLTLLLILILLKLCLHTRMTSRLGLVFMTHAFLPV